jgi:uncharacterized membrane protein YgcG
MTFRPLHDRVVVRLVEDEQKKDCVPDAMHATEAAAEEGVVPGGGTALHHAKAAVAKLKTNNPDMKACIKVVQRALEAPIQVQGRSSGDQASHGGQGVSGGTGGGGSRGGGGAPGSTPGGAST